MLNITGVYEVGREVRGEGAGILKRSFCGKVGAGQTGKLVRSFGESSRCGDHVFGSRVTTSTLAGEYVTAREYVGGRVSWRNFGTSSCCTRSEIRGKLWCAMYVLLNKGRLTMELGVVMTRQNFGFPVPSSCSVCCVMARGDRGRHERGDAKRG